MLCFPLDSKKMETSVTKKKVCGGRKDVRKQAYLSKLANIINYPVRYCNVANLITCHTVVDERVSKANSSFTETSGSDQHVM